MWLLLAACNGPAPSVPTQSIATMPVPNPTLPTPPIPTPVPEREWVRVVVHPCAQDAEGYVECWGGSDGVDEIVAIPPSPAPMLDFVVWEGLATGVLENRLGLNWWCNPVPHAPECDQVPDGVQFNHISGGCGETIDRQILYWDEHGDEPVLVSEDQVYLFAAHYYDLCVVMTDDNLGRIHGPFSTAQFAFPPTRTYVQIAPLAGMICALDSEGLIDCRGTPWEGWQIPTFDNPPYVELGGDTYAVCAKRPDHVIECHNGQTFDFGPVRDFDVQTSRYNVPSDNPNYDYEQGPAGWDGPLSICVITEDNAVICEGLGFPQGVLDQLPTGNRPALPD